MQETQETQVQFLSQENALEDEMAIYSSILAWKNPWTQEPGRYCPQGHKESGKTEHIVTFNNKMIEN